MVRAVSHRKVHTVRFENQSKELMLIDDARALSNNSKEADLTVYVTGDGPDIYEDALMKLAKTETGVFAPTLVLVGTRLGIDRVTPVYRDALKAALQLPQAVGIAG